LPWAWEIVQALDSYTEVSPSGAGLKVIVRGQLPAGRRGWDNGNGMYDRARFFTLTGWRLEGTPATVEERGEALAALHARLFPPTAPRPTAEGGVPVDLDDAEIVRRAMGAKNGAKFSRLWLGEWSDYASRSEADMALCSMLAFWCGGDAARVGRLFEQSGLYREGKWGRASYRERTVEKGNQRAEYYTPRPRQGAGSAGRGRLILGRAGG
jgi:primase-polymerase (primpol)-like protein